MLALLGVRACVVEPVRVASDSMRPTLHAGDWVLIDKVSDRWRPFVAGDVVMLSEPGSGRSIIKRIVALGGQAVELDDGRLVVDGAFVAEPYADLSRMAGRYLGPITVPPGHVFVLGDNRDDSRDSRVFGPVPTASVTGRMVARIGGSG